MDDIAGPSSTSVAPFTDEETTLPQTPEAEEVTLVKLGPISDDSSSPNRTLGSASVAPHFKTQLHDLQISQIGSGDESLDFKRPQWRRSPLNRPLVERTQEIAPPSPSTTLLDDSLSEDDFFLQINDESSGSLDDCLSSSDEEEFFDALTSPQCEQFILPGSPPTDGTRLLPVITNILSYFVGQQDGYKTLYSASLVCKALSPFALDALWKTMPDIAPIYFLLPIHNTYGNVLSYNSSNPEFDWTTFFAYSQRIHTINLTKPPGIILSPQVLLTLPRLHPEPLLPNLCSVEIDRMRDSCPLTLLHILTVFSPSISSLSLNGIPKLSFPLQSGFPMGHMVALDILQAMNTTPAYCTDSFTNLRISAVLSSALLDQILLSKTLEFLSLTALDSELPLPFIQQLASLRSLVTLELNVSSSAVFKPFARDKRSQDDADFKNLEVLRLSGSINDVNAIVSLFEKRYSRRHIHTLEIAYTQEMAPKFRDISLITQAFKHIRHLKIRVLPNLIAGVLPLNPPNEGSNPTSPRANYPAARIRIDEGLWRRLTFGGIIESIEFFGVQILTCCRDIIPICTSLPESVFHNLHTLRLTSSDDSETLTLHTLGAISSQLPRLKTLLLYINSANHNEVELQNQIKQAKLRSPHALESLFINNTNDTVTANISAAMVVSNFIHSMFPSLKKVGVFKPYALQAERAVGSNSATDTKSVDDEWWLMVFKLIRLLQYHSSKTRPVISLG